VRYIFIILILYSQTTGVSAQHPLSKGAAEKKDSLRTVLASSKPDTTRIRALFELFLLLKRSDLDEKIIQYASESLPLSQKQNYQWGIGASYYMKSFCAYAKRNYEQALDDIANAERIMETCGDKKNTGSCIYLRANIFYDMGNYPGSVDNCTRALETWEAIGYKGLTGPCCNDLALSYGRLGNYSKAIEYAYKGLRVSETLDDKAIRAQSLHLIGAYYYRFGDYENAMKNFEVASAIYLELGNRFDFARNNNMTGEVLLDQGHCSEAQQRFYQSLKIYEEPGAPAWGAPWGYSNLGSVDEKQGDSANATGGKEFATNKYREALNNYTISLKGFEEIKDPAGTAEQTIFIGKIYFKLGQVSMAGKYLFDGLKLSGKFGEKQNLTLCYLYLSQIDSAEGNAWQAYEHYKLYTLYRDSMFNKESSHRLSVYKVQYEFEKKDQELKLLAAENKLQSALADKQNQRRKFAWIIAGLILCGAAFAFYRYRRLHRIKAEQKLLKERLTISQDLHDHVGSTLSSISVFSKVAQLQGEENKKEEMNELLGRIRTTSNTMITEMNDIVWAINPVNDTMEKIIRRMEAYARPLLEARNMSFHFHYEERLFTGAMEMEKRKNFYLIFKEAINNAAKYSASPQVDVRLQRQNENLVLEIRDTGIGFDPGAVAASTSLSGNGLRNMQQRAKAINAELFIESMPGKGTLVRLSCPV
jgi:signal transduction histidine kinase